MFKKFEYFLPDFKQCWCLVFFLLVVGMILAAPTSFFGDIEIIGKLLAYLIPFVPVFFYITYKSNKIILQEQSTGIAAEKVKLNDPYFGNMNPFLFFILIALVIFAFQVVLDPVSRIMPTPEWFDRIMEQEMGGNKLIAIITIAVCAPLFEEFLCRGMMCRGMLRHYSPTWAILWSAFFFAFIHMNPWQAVPAFVTGIFFGWIYYKTRCLWAPIFLHALNNGASLAVSYIYPEISDATLKDIIPDNGTYMVVYAISVGILALVYFLISNYIPNRTNGTKEETAISA